MCSAIQQQYNCCCSLRVGSIVFSILLLIIPAASFVFLPVATVAFAREFADYPGDVKQFDMFSAKIEAVLFIPRLVYTAVNVLAVVLLIVGACKQNSKLLLPWLVFMTINCIGGTVGAIAILVFIICLIYHFTVKLIFVIIFFVVLLCVAFWWYFLLCVWSYYKELQLANLQKPKQSAV